MNETGALIARAAAEGLLLESARRNILLLLNRPDCAGWERASVAELASCGKWGELNDRFYQRLEFGTGGLRGRTIGKIVTHAETGKGTGEVPEFPAAGTNTMNFFNVAITTRGLVSYLLSRFPGEAPRVAISYDTRHFSPAFSSLAAQIVANTGGTAYLFEDVRPTPELSFAVRRLDAQAGIMITASHNPPHDNGYKVYFADGGQIVEPHASAIIEAVRAAQQGQGEAPAGAGQVVKIGAEMDADYLAAVEETVIRRDLLERQAPNLKVVYTPIHGTGIKAVPQALRAAGVEPLLVEEQATCDGRFPTVKSPNPENREALAMAVDLGRRQGADAVLATDPDCDRMGVAVRNAEGDYEYLNGNEIGSAIAEYRLSQLFASGVLNAANASHAAIIKTFVTTDLMKSIAEAYGVRCIETLTGFKYIGAKLLEYETAAGGRHGASHDGWRARLLEKSTYSVWAAEESYGYLAEDYVRDKDAAGAALAFVELLAYARESGITLPEFLNRIYLKHGYYAARLGTLTYEGESGAAKIAALLESYDSEPPAEWAGRRVIDIRNFGAQDIMDADGKLLPRELMLVFRLAGGASVTTRASGTEPKIKFYFSVSEPVASPDELAAKKTSVGRALDDLWAFTQADAEARLARRAR
jgi:phosphoglucomutase